MSWRQQKQQCCKKTPLLSSKILYFSVPIIPEFLYSIRHQHDHFTTPRIRITTTITTTPQTPFGFNETNYGDPAAPFDFIGNTVSVKLNQKFWVWALLSTLQFLTGKQRSVGNRDSNEWDAKAQDVSWFFCKYIPWYL